MPDYLVTVTILGNEAQQTVVAAEDALAAIDQIDAGFDSTRCMLSKGPGMEPKYFQWTGYEYIARKMPELQYVEVIG